MVPKCPDGFSNSLFGFKILHLKMVWALIIHLIISETCKNWYSSQMKAAETKCEHNTDISLAHWPDGDVLVTDAC